MAQTGSPGPTPPATPTATQLPLPKEYMPKKPTMGGVNKTTDTEYTAWCGGEPKANWTGLVDPDGPTCPYQWRRVAVDSATKGHKARIAGLDTKFNEGDKLEPFLDLVKKHLTKYGMDTISYLPNPSDPTKMISVVGNYARFTMDEATKAQETLTAFYDIYDKQNDAEAGEYVSNSISDDLRNQVRNNCPDGSSFITIWMSLMQTVRTVSFTRFESIKKKIKDLNPKDFPGENIIMIADEYLEAYKELSAAEVYDHELTLTMLRSIIKGGGTGFNGQRFRHDLLTLETTLNDKLMSSRHLNYKDAQTEMTKAGCDVHTVLCICKDRYRTMYQEGLWAAAQHATDSKAISRNYGTANHAEVTRLKKMVNALIQQVDSGGPKRDNDKCLNCGKTGHWARNCPDKARNKPSPNRRKFDNPKRGGQSIKLPPPKPGESQTKMLNGKKLLWCSKCNRWSSTHGTSEHKSKEDLQAGNRQANTGIKRVDFDLHPSAFMAIGPGPTGFPHQDKETDPVALLLSRMDPIPPATPSVAVGPSSNKTPTAATWLLALATTILLPIGLTIMWQVMKPIEPEASTTSFHEYWYLTTIMHLMTGTLSFVVGFGTSFWLYKRHDEPHSKRMRSGQGIIKQWNRKAKHHHQMIHHRSRRRGWSKPPRLDTDYHRYLMMHAPPDHVRNLPRPSRGIHPCCTEYRFKIDQLNARMDNMLRQLNRMEFAANRVSEGDGPSTRRGTRRGRRSANYQPRSAFNEPDPRGRGNNRSASHSPFHSTIELPSPINPPRSNHQVFMSTLNPKETVLWDSGANCCMSHVQSDFIDGIQPSKPGEGIDGIANSRVKIEGIGTIAWTFKCTDGSLRTIQLPCHYVPSSNQRILSTTLLLSQSENEHIELTHEYLILLGDPNLSPIMVMINQENGLPLGDLHETQASAHMVNYEKVVRPAKNAPKPALASLPKSLSSTHAENFNLSPVEKELLGWHYRLGHINMRRIQWMFRHSFIGGSEQAKRLQTAASKLISGPLCTACQYAKQQRKAQPGTTVRQVQEQSGALKGDQLFPGQRTSIDHFHSNPKGRLLDTYGKESNDDKFTGGCIFVDHSSSYIQVVMQS